ncbi:hypothetical protein [Streptomyces sp. NPDC048272]|uniref:zinc finger domain-containing protein n=1 Tax=Streptomyces sp. NPDC048272 TaxID=3154616 RepID=UPI00342F6F73
MRGDNRQIQTAVLSDADSEEPLTLPLEAIELDAFRKRHKHDTFWCGLLLGGCGGQLTTKLYTDRVCHFAHHPGTDGLCGRRDRGVASADHLYVKAAASAWLRTAGGLEGQVHFDFARPDGAEIGSVLDIRFKERGLRVHLDQAVAPVWDEDGREPVLGLSVPVDRDTLIDRWYVHRIRLDSVGTSRQVRIGTEAFMRPTDWFELDECEMTERGLSTPAVERIIRSRKTRPTSQWAQVKARRKEPDAQVQALGLLKRLADARKVEAVGLVGRLCDEIEALARFQGEPDGQLAVVVKDARQWIEGQAEARQELFFRLDQAVDARDPVATKRFVVWVNGTASHHRTDSEAASVAAAGAFLADSARQQQAETEALRAEQKHLRAKEEAERARELLKTLERNGLGQPRKTMRRLVRDLERAVSAAGNLLDADQRQQFVAWRTRTEVGRRRAHNIHTKPVPASRGPVTKRKLPLYEQVERRSWYAQTCPRCLAKIGKACLNDDGIGNGRHRQLPHDERLRLVIGIRKPRTEPSPAQRTEWRVTDITCPTCKAGPGQRCSPGGHPHHARATQFKLRFPSQ